MERGTLMKISVLVVLVLLISSILIYVAMQNNGGQVREAEQKVNPIAVVNTTMGNFEIELFEKEFSKDKEHNSIQLVKNFEKYALSGFYNGLIIHKVAGMHKGYEACSNGSVGRTVIYTGEYYENLTKKKLIFPPLDYGWRTDVLFGLKHTDLMVSWFDSHHITSLFYICNGDWSNSENPQNMSKEPDFDIYDPVFGKVVDGVDVVRKIGSISTHSEVNRTKDINLTCVPNTTVVIRNIKIYYPHNSSSSPEEDNSISDHVENISNDYSFPFMRNLYSNIQKNVIHRRNMMYPTFSCTHTMVLGP
jgi:cyclophilin family peptidyl-prolyl cis-trans isomerase